jgi:hypothetical protein
LELDGSNLSSSVGHAFLNLKELDESYNNATSTSMLSGTDAIYSVISLPAMKMHISPHHQAHVSYLCLASSLESTGETLDVALDCALVPQELNVGTIDQNAALLLEFDILVASERSETPVLADDDLLATGELVHGSSKGLDGSSTMCVSSSDGKENLANVDTGDRSVGLAPGTSHSSLQSIGTGARQHLVDTDDVEWVSSNSEMETFLASNLDEIFVCANTGCFQGL